MSDVVQMNGVDYTLTRPPAAQPGHVVTYAEPATAVRPLRLLTLGDSFTDSREAAEGGWAPAVARQCGVELINLAAGGSGYVRLRESTYPLAATRAPDDVSVAVVFGSLNDQHEQPDAVAAAARATYAVLRRVAPRAPLIVVGPQWAAGPVPALLPPLRDRIRVEAQAAGAVWLDALQWLAGRPDWIGPDGLHPNADGQRELAQRIGPTVAAALTALRL